MEYRIKRWESWQLHVTFMWNDQQNMLARDDELMLCFQLFESCNMSTIEFELILVPNAIHFPEYEPTGLLGFNEQNIGNLIEETNDELVKQDNVEPDEENNEEGSTELVEENTEEDNTKLVEETENFSEEDNEYKCTREVIKKYKGLTLKNIKNDKYKYTVTCKNDACDWRLHASCLMNRVTFMIKSVRGSHSMCPREVKNKGATSRWAAFVLGNFICSNPTSKTILFKKELQDRFTVKVDSQTIYREKKIALETLKIHHAEAYAKRRKYGNAIYSMNPGTDVKVAMDPHMK
ncbi:hypothetical protein Ddye_005977 [Dipteronia dyeriana]|uniref:Transposase MuDR plant domain-containing protein n=1 Tax=Dipteronia dyeriana TaxID=168575 RepID=A0AAD9XH94_9ROSI|nr:hypothetical protein Ddye_005977 [Dipteronia dyeriana]